MLDLLGQQSPPPRDYLSYSAIRTYQGCPLRYYFRYIAGLPENIVASSLLFGIGLHAALEAHFRGLLVGQTIGLDQLFGAFWRGWNDRQPPEVLFGKGENFTTVGELASRMLRTFLNSDQVTPRGTILGVEEELRGPVISGLPDLLARVDLIVHAGDALVVTDFKSSRSHWDRDQVINAADQLLLYSELVRELADGRPLRLEFVVLTKTKVPSVTRHPVAYDARQVERTKHTVEHVWHAIEAGHFYPNPSSMLCPTCPFRQPCANWQG